MKHLIFLTSLLFFSLLYACPNCMDHSEHLTKPNDTKEEHTIECNCDCTTIKNNYCTECSHLQNAHPLIIIKRKAISNIQQPKIYEPKDPQDILKKLVAQHLLRE